MGFNVSIKDILLAGGPTLALLILLSIYSIALIWERWRFHETATAGLKAYLDKVRAALGEGRLQEVSALSKSYKGLAAGVVAATLVGPTNRDDRKRCAQRAAERATALLETRVAQLGTIASVSPFIGLLGTVLGVMRAFKDLAGAAGAGPGVIAIGISEALVCTAAGLFVAIPAVVAYNYFTRRAQRFLDEMNWIIEELLESLSEKAHR